MTEPKSPTEYHEANRRSWNEATVAHNTHKKDQAGFLRRGGSTLFPEEIELLGDVTGKRLVHLLCNAGQDSLSIARLGAEVTGVDISDEAIDFATKLSTESGIPATFIRSDVYGWLRIAREEGQTFDVAFCSYGATCWLSDLTVWAQGVFDVLRPGGRFVAIEFHPMSMMFNEQFELTYPYFGNDTPLKWEEGVQDYVAASGTGLTPAGAEEGTTNFENPHPVYEFLWTIGDIITALIGAGFVIERYQEYAYANGAKVFADMRETAGRRMRPPEGVPNVPMMYAVVASKPIGRP